MASASGIYEKEDHRKPAIFPNLAAALSAGMTKVVNLDLTSPDGAVVVSLIGDIHETVALLLAEDKREVGEGACDASTQASLSMIRYWVQKDVRALGICAQLSLTNLFSHSAASCGTTVAAPHSFSPLVGRGLLC